MNRLQRRLILAVSTKDWQVRCRSNLREPPHAPVYPDLSPLVKALARRGEAIIDQLVRPIQPRVLLETLA